MLKSYQQGILDKAAKKIIAPEALMNRHVGVKMDHLTNGVGDVGRGDDGINHTN